MEGHFLLPRESNRRKGVKKKRKAPIRKTKEILAGEK